MFLSLCCVVYLGKFGHFLGNNGALLLLGNHDLESIKIVQTSTLLSRRQFLGPGTRFPSGQSITRLPRGCESLLPCTALDLDGQVGHGNTSERNHLAAHTRDGFRTVNQTPVLVDNVNDGCQLALFRTIVDQDHAANFHVSLERHLECSSVFVGVYCTSVKG
jgi:hypothetical protein